MNNAGNAAEPPSCLRPPIFMIGRDCRGNWVAQEQSGARGGLFVDRAAAVKFARFEGGADPHAIVWVSGEVELMVMAVPTIASAPCVDSSVQRQRRFA